MPRKSVRPNKNIFQTAREEAGLTREKASASIGYMSESVIEKIEYDQVMPDPQEVMDMAKAYRKPELINYYCSNMCAIGRQYMPEVKTTGLSQIVLHILASMNALEKEKDRLVEITVDGTISGDELKDFVRIRNMVNQISMAADAMNLWIEQSIAAGSVNREELEAVSEELKQG